MARKNLFRVGNVSCYLRGRVWYLRYHEHGRRRQVRASVDRDATKQLAAQVNAQLETGAPAATSYEPIAIPALRDRWLEHHEHVLRSSVATIDRYRTTTEHLVRFLDQEAVPKRAANFAAAHAERFAHHLRNIHVAPNGHKNAATRPLRDKGIKYILEVCRTMFNYAIKRRHMPPYADNPFSVIEIDRIPVEDAKPFIDLPPEKERQLLELCDDWQFPIFATLMLTGLRPGELSHLLLPDDPDLGEGRHEAGINITAARFGPSVLSDTVVPREIDVSAGPHDAGSLRARGNGGEESRIPRHQMQICAWKTMTGDAPKPGKDGIDTQPCCNYNYNSSRPITPLQAFRVFGSRAFHD